MGILSAILGCIFAVVSFLVLLTVAFGIDWIAKRKMGNSPYSPSDYGPLYEQERLVALERDGYRCQVCGVPANITHHIVPRRQGGPDTRDNLMTVCRPCHAWIEP